ncbi:MAG TPA: LacI family DNA-binding transcriptional regulator, partial [Streptosporangiaceae bacterium]|nr:LacI family DNA-binding transcriptional regulator [Streptosporangiaceae bacterium]
MAALAGVSLKTVSRVINGTPTVDPALTDQVQRAAALLNYKPNLTASSLRRRDGRSMMIGLMLEDIANPYSSTIYRAAEDVARGLGVGLLAGSLEEDPERERELAAALIVRRVDGLLIAPAGQDHSYLLGEMKMVTPLVFIDRSPRYLAADAVVSDNRAGTAKGVRHLIEHGHRRIAYLGDLSSITTAQERFAGFQDALREAGLGLDDRMVRHDLHTIDAATAAATELLTGSSPPTALFSGQNLVTIGTVRALRAAGLQHRTALIGFDDFPLADLLEPGITVIAQDPASIG